MVKKKMQKTYICIFDIKELEVITSSVTTRKKLKKLKSMTFLESIRERRALKPRMAGESRLSLPRSYMEQSLQEQQN